VEKQAEVFGVRVAETREPEIEAEPEVRDLPKIYVPPPVPIPAEVTQLVMFAVTHVPVQQRKAPRRPSSPITASDQLGLFQN
jgi:hypothetical protein